MYKATKILCEAFGLNLFHNDQALNLFQPNQLNLT